MVKNAKAEVNIMLNILNIEELELEGRHQYLITEISLTFSFLKIHFS